MKVTKCICRNVDFKSLKEIAAESGINDITALGKKISVGDNCGLCIPYIQKMLDTGETEILIIIPNPNENY